MKKQKFNSITFHEAAAKIVDRYFGEIPDFELQTTAKVKSVNGTIQNRFWINYENTNYNRCSVVFLKIEDTPVLALEKFEISMKSFWDIPIPEETPEIIDFDLLY